MSLAEHQSAAEQLLRQTAAASLAAESEAHSGTHSHFKCNTCGDVICLDEATALPEIPVPAGYRRDALELTVKGLCASCAPRAHIGASRKLRAGRRDAKG